LYVEDHARALCQVLEHGQIGETYNVGGRNERTDLYVVEQICRLLDLYEPTSQGDRKRLITIVADRPGHDRRYAIDATNWNANSDWKAKESFETGLEKTVVWYLNNKQWWQSIQCRGYSADRIGMFPAG